METQNCHEHSKESSADPGKKDYFLPISILIAGVMVSGSLLYFAGFRFSDTPWKGGPSAVILGAQEATLEEKVLPSEGVTLPITWRDLGTKMLSVGVIDKEKFYSLYEQRGGLDEEERRLLENTDNGRIKITLHNSGFLLNLFWALGLGSKNDILEKGPMMSPQYGGAGNFASTGGWTLAKGDAMDHYSRHPLIVLTPEQQKLVERVSKGIFRPCCNNPTYFPDCNHGMAMLGLLELMAAQGVGEEDMYKVALQVNAYWFPDTYLTVAQYLASKGIDWNDVDPKDILGADYSSSSGFNKVRSQVIEPERRGGGSCGA